MVKELFKKNRLGGRISPPPPRSKIGLIGIDPDLTRLHLIETENMDHFKEIVRKEIGNSSKLNLYSSMKDDFKDKQYISDGKYYKYRLTVAKFRNLGHAFPFEKGR